MTKNTGISTEESEQSLTVLAAEDEIITLFCQNIGGMEFAMPIVRKQFQDTGIDFKKPTKDELIIIVNKLVEITRELQGKAAARDGFRHYMHIINKIND
jgi:hypothetical protein